MVGYFLNAADGADPAMMQVLEVKHGQAAPIEDPHADVLSALPEPGQRVKELARSILAQRGVQAPGGAS